jgi:hypothetical protein
MWCESQSNAASLNGVFKKSESYSGIITPQPGSAPLRIGTRDLKSFFLGAIKGVRVWDRVLTAAEVQMVASDSVPQDGLVAEYRLDQDVAMDTTELHNGRIVGGSWMPFEDGP